MCINNFDMVISVLCVVGSNAACCGSLGGIGLFLQLLQSDLDHAAYLQIVLTLAHCTDACGRSTSASLSSPH